ncbi:MAG TPA: hypothetical protein PKL65_05380 [Bacteroidales bacterium]|jgi:hypothetical protein|nr:hypothetical protein [Bacteroidales bacterium]HNR41644.1 hypothetical protein [Bacteroidales bacterium]HPM18652.1 hypothetical protein [Bacteroidales bacterium]HQG77702.1 hypothetical protein [Bacteroidales bacterium]
MKTLLDKLNYRGQLRIAIINPESNFKLAPSRILTSIQIDDVIDQRFPYGFMMIFVREPKDIEKYAPLALHNLATDGLLWFCYPKKTSNKYCPGIDRNHGWKVLNEMDFYGTRVVTIDDDWAALRFRNKKFIKSRADKSSK